MKGTPCQWTGPNEVRVPAVKLAERETHYGTQVLVRVDGREFWTVRSRVTGQTRASKPVGLARGMR